MARHPNSLANLQPQSWKKGQSGNPKGGSAKRTIEKIFNDFLMETAKAKDGTEKERLRAIMEGQWLAAVKGNTPAANFFVDRVAGKAPQTINHNIEETDVTEARKEIVGRLLSRESKKDTGGKK
jgi:hypothetical protein